MQAAPAGGTLYTICLPANTTYSFSTHADSLYGDLALPVVRGNLQLKGLGENIVNVFGQVDLTNVTFENNAATHATDGHGGAIYNYQGTLNGEAVVFEDNAAAFSAGAKLTLIKIAFTDREASGTSSGGVVRVDNGTLVIKNSGFGSNEAQTAGVIYNNLGRVEVDDTVFNVNNAHTAETRERGVMDHKTRGMTINHPPHFISV